MNDRRHAWQGRSDMKLTAVEVELVEQECLAAIATGIAADPKGEPLRRLLDNLIHRNIVDTDVLSRATISEVAQAIREAGFKRSAASITDALDAEAAAQGNGATSRAADGIH